MISCLDLDEMSVSMCKTELALNATMDHDFPIKFYSLTSCQLRTITQVEASKH